MIISPLAPKTFPNLPAIAGVKLAAGNAGLRYSGRPEVLYVECSEGTAVAGVFTRSLTAAAPVLACQHNLKHGKGRVLVVNAGNSNAFTGKAGEESVRRIVASACGLSGAPPEECYTASTGVIGQKLADDKITTLLPTLKTQLSETAWEAAARAIMTTDTFPKLATRRVRLAGGDVTINGIAKGSGMIAPDMATLLAFFFTDANISHALLQQAFAACNEESFNCITVDGDTSTSDVALIFATGQAKHAAILSADDPHLTVFAAALKEIMVELAQQVVRDGEGASKFITITVGGAESQPAAKRIALSIANSPLVKTAIAGNDANWGRVVMAVGKAGERADRDKLSIKFGDQFAATNGQLNPAYDEQAATAHVSGQEVSIEVDVGVGDASATVWTCDLTHGYIDINGSYRT